MVMFTGPRSEIKGLHIVNSKNVNKKLFGPMDHLELFLTNDPIGVTEVKLDYHRPTDQQTDGQTGS